MDFILDLADRRSTMEQHPTAGPQVLMRNLIQDTGITPTFKVFRLDENSLHMFIPRLWSKVYAPATGVFTLNQNRYYTSENCARMALAASYRQQFYYDNGMENRDPIDAEIEMMVAAYRDPDVVPTLVEAHPGNHNVRIPVAAYYLAGPGRFYLVQKL